MLHSLLPFRAASPSRERPAHARDGRRKPMKQGDEEPVPAAMKKKNRRPSAQLLNPSPTLGDKNSPDQRKGQYSEMREERGGAGCSSSPQYPGKWEASPSGSPQTEHHLPLGEMSGRSKTTPLQQGGDFGQRKSARLDADALSRSAAFRSASPNMAQNRALLERIEFVQQLTDSERERLLQCLVQRTFSPDDVLIRYNTEPQWLYIIVAGVVRIVGREAGQLREVCELGAGDTVGELEFLNNHTCVADVIAKTRVITWRLHREDFDRCMQPLMEVLRRQTSGDKYDYYKTVANSCDPRVFDEYYGDEEQTSMFRPGRDLKGAKTVHHFTNAERDRMRNFEAIDYWEPNTRMQKQYREEQAGQQGYDLRWLIFAIIGVCVGLFSVVLNNTIETIEEFRRELVLGALEDDKLGGAFRACLLWTLSGLVCVTVSSCCCAVWPAAAGSGVPDVMAYLNGIMFPKVFDIRTLVVKVVSCALAVGGGLPVGPEGPMIHIGALVGGGLSSGRSRLFRCSCDRLTARYRNPRDRRDFITGGAAAGVACAFGAPIGGLLFIVEEISSSFSKKGMWMAFFSSLMGIVTTHTFNSKMKGWQPRHSAGEVGCGDWAYWDHEFTTLFPTNVLSEVNLITVLPTLGLGIVCGLMGALFTFCNLKVVRFRTTVVNKSTRRRIAEPAVILILWCVLCFLAVSVQPCYPLPEGFVQEAGELVEVLGAAHRRNATGGAENATTAGWDLNHGSRYSGLELFGAICPEPERQYHPLGSLVFAPPDDVVRLLFRRDAPGSNAGFDLFPFGTLTTYLSLYFALACWAAGSFLASGIVIPMLTIGALLGRAWGVVVAHVVAASMGTTCGAVQWADPGVMALIGAAGFFGGVSRLTFSLCVITLELSGDLPHLPNVMFCVMVAKAVADRFTHALYHALLEVRSIPFLDTELDTQLPYLDVFSAGNVMASPAVTLVERVPLSRIVEVLNTTRHNAFPVIDDHTGARPSPGPRPLSPTDSVDGRTPLSPQSNSSFGSPRTPPRRFRGFVLRAQLERIVHWADRRLNQDDGRLNPLDPDAEGSRARLFVGLGHKQMEELADTLFWEQELGVGAALPSLPASVLSTVVDLAPFCNNDSFSIPVHFSVAATYTLFRSMGLRQLAVVDRENQVQGVVTRKDLIAQNVEERTTGALGPAERPHADPDASDAGPLLEARPGAGVRRRGTGGAAQPAGQGAASAAPDC